MTEEKMIKKATALPVTDQPGESINKWTDKAEKSKWSDTQGLTSAEWHLKHKEENNCIQCIKNNRYLSADKQKEIGKGYPYCEEHRAVRNVYRPPKDNCKTWCDVSYANGNLPFSRNGFGSAICDFPTGCCREVWLSATWIVTPRSSSDPECLHSFQIITSPPSYSQIKIQASTVELEEIIYQRMNSFEVGSFFMYCGSRFMVVQGDDEQKYFVELSTRTKTVSGRLLTAGQICDFKAEQDPNRPASTQRQYENPERAFPIDSPIEKQKIYYKLLRDSMNILFQCKCPAARHHGRLIGDELDIHYSVWEYLMHTCRPFEEPKKPLTWFEAIFGRWKLWKK